MVRPPVFAFHLPMAPRRPAPRRRPRIGGAWALAVFVVLALGVDDAEAATVRSSASALGALAVFAALLFIREWPVALTGSVWIAGTLFALALWFLRAGPGLGWLSPGPANGDRSMRGRAAATTVLDAAEPQPSPGVGADEVLAAARHCFVRLQAAWDAGDTEEMRRYTTAEMLDELMQELPMRDPGPNQTDVVTLDATLLGLETMGSRYVASIEFSGMIRESAERGAAPFKELWLLTCPANEVPGWRLARHQALM